MNPSVPIQKFLSTLSVDFQSAAAKWLEFSETGH